MSLESLQTLSTTSESLVVTLNFIFDISILDPFIIIENLGRRNVRGLVNGDGGVELVLRCIYECITETLLKGGFPNTT